MLEHPAIDHVPRQLVLGQLAQCQAEILVMETCVLILVVKS
jgi:hypothetical protein